MIVDEANQGNLLPPAQKVEVNPQGLQRILTESAHMLAYGVTPSTTDPSLVYTSPEQTYSEVKEILVSVASGGVAGYDLYIAPPGEALTSAHLRQADIKVVDGRIHFKTALNPLWQLGIAGHGGIASLRYLISGTQSA